MLENYKKEIKTMQNKVFMKTALAITISALFSILPLFIGGNIINTLFISQSTAGSIVRLIAMIAILTFAMTRIASDVSIGVKRFWFVFVSAFIGLTLSSIFIVYKLGSILSVFIISLVYFVVLYIFSKTTNKDFTKYSSVLFVSLITLIIMMVINMIFPMGMLSLIISFAAIVVFSFYTVHDFQLMVKYIVDCKGFDNDEFDSISYSFAINLYLDFINLFVNLLEIFGDFK